MTAPVLARQEQQPAPEADPAAATPHHHLGAATILVCALVACGPSLLGALAGSVTVDTLLIRLLLALAGSTVAVRAVDRVISGYTKGHQRRG